MQIIPGSNGNGMQKDVQFTPSFCDLRKDGSHPRVILHVQRRDDLGPDLFCQRANMRFCFFIQIGDRDICALRAKGLGTAPCDRARIGDTHDQCLFSVQSKHTDAHIAIFAALQQK